jgi:hypothetical protein
MSAETLRTDRFPRLALIGLLVGCSGMVIAQDAKAPDLEFLEYLGSWEESDEDWVALATDAVQQALEEEGKDEGKDPAPDGEKLAESDDEN